MTVYTTILSLKEQLDHIMEQSASLRDALPDDAQSSIVQLRKYMLNGIQTLSNLEDKLTVAMGQMEVPGTATLNNSSSHE